MDDNFDKAAIAVIIAFGALIVGGLMAANLSVGDRTGFLFALGAGFAAWIAGYMILFDLPRAYAALIGISAIMAVASTWRYAF
jgi:predicted aspartyl protease